jgi:hypothetical protein
MFCNIWNILVAFSETTLVALTGKARFWSVGNGNGNFMAIKVALPRNL